MNGFGNSLLLAFVATSMALADGPGVIESKRAGRDATLTADPNAEFWRGVKGVIAKNDAMGQPIAGHDTEIRSRWTGGNLYLLFICPYSELHLKADPQTAKETNKLWNWDVAEAFIGADPKRIRRYKEFQVSPQREWVDLDIDRDTPLPEGGWLWNSGFEVTATVDSTKKVWYGAMKIPYKSIDERPAATGNELRINLYRCQGPPPDRKLIAWQPTNQKNFHVPEAFGKLKLVE